MSRRLLKSGIAALAVAAATTAAYGQWFGGKDAKSIPIQDAADMLHAVMEADRTVYTQRVVNRLMLQEKVITADEHFMDKKQGNRFRLTARSDGSEFRGSRD